MTPDQIFATVLALMSPDTDPTFDALSSGGNDPRYPLTVEACPRPLGPLEVEGKTILCGRIAVPENHDALGGKTVPLAFAVLKARSLSPAPDPVIYLHGGPGGHAVQELDFNAEVFDFLRDRRDIIMFDQRASGISDRTVACYTELSADFIGFAQPDEAKISDPNGPLAKCISEIYASGIDLSLYNTTQSALDVRAIMDALGYPIYNAFGVSYGTKLGQELLRSAPEGLRSLVIDSISRVDNPAYDTNGVPSDQALGWIVDFCAADAACAAAFPNLEADVAKAAEVLDSQGVTIAGNKVGPELIAQLLDQSNKFNGPFTAYMPQVITELAKGETKTVTTLLARGFNPDNSPAAVVARNGTGLSDSDKIFAEVLLMQSQQMRSLEATAGKLMVTLAGDLSPLGAAATEQLLDDALSEAARTMDQARLLALLQAYAGFVGQTPDRAKVETFVRQYLPETEQPRLLAILAAMSDADVTAFYDRAAIDAARVTSGAKMLLTLGIIACQEDIPFNSQKGYDAVAADYRFPVIDKGMRASDSQMYTLCAFFKSHPRQGFHDPVTSDLPVLAMAGTKDTATNPDAAEKVIRTLSNGQAVLFPEAGHTVIQFSQCAKDVAVSFLETPSAPVNTGCTEALKPKFYVPAAAQ